MSLHSEMTSHIEGMYARFDKLGLGSGASLVAGISAVPSGASSGSDSAASGGFVDHAICRRDLDEDVVWDPSADLQDPDVPMVVPRCSQCRGKKRKLRA